MPYSGLSTSRAYVGDTWRQCAEEWEEGVAGGNAWAEMEDGRHEQLARVCGRHLAGGDKGWGGVGGLLGGVPGRKGERPEA
eukprot:73024-Chlamydomonas_euryale.AAC.4